MSLTDLGVSIFLDRYAQKSPHAGRDAKVNDTVLVIVEKGKRKQGTVVQRLNDIVDVELQDGKIIEDIPVTDIELPIETTPQQMWKRVAAGIASVENPHIEDLIRADFEWLLDDWKFVPGGRILASAGTPYKMTAFNCFVINSPKDSRGGIIHTLGEMTEIMSRGGGVGINFSSLRPQNALVRGVNGRSSGPVPFINIYSEMTGTIEQAGTRRGALMAMINDWHPDVFNFIKAKRTPGYMVNCNISVCLSDEFMAAVKHDRDWTLVFPDTSTPQYDELWDGNLDKWLYAGYEVIEYKTIKARELWDAIISSAHASAEPGLFFIDRANQMSNSNYYDAGQIIATNPCGEEPLPANGVCNLGAINLSKFVTSVNSVDWMPLQKAVRLAVRFLDDVIDWTPYFYEANFNQQRDERRVGLGIMGLADMMIQCQVRYGSDEGVTFVDRLMGFIARQAYVASVELAQEKGAFPKFEAEGFLASGYMQCMPDSIRSMVQKDGIRNVTLLTIAPTGTTSTMLNTSGGVEPFFALEWERTSRLGTHKESVAGLDVDSPLPSWVVTAMELTPEEHLKTQAAAQRWIDAAISKTVNMPKTTTVAEVGALYQTMYDLGCKGGTIYVDQSRSEQVLNLAPQSAAPQCDDCKIDMYASEGCWKCSCGNELCQS